MESVSFLGLGPMGSALARSLLQNQTAVSVWNRTSSRAEPLVQMGATHSGSPAIAAASSPLTIICVADYDTADGVLRSPGCTEALRGRTLVQLSTGSPQQARETAAWARRNGINYLDGAILVTPSQIGSPESAMLVSGDEDVFRRAEPVLRMLAAGVQYVGEAPGAAAALDLAFLSHFFGGLLGFYHGARIMEAEGLSVRELGAMIAQVAPALGRIIHHDAVMIEENRFGRSESTLRNSATIVDLVARHARDAGLDPGFPAYAAALFRRGLDVGFGEEDTAALVKVLRRPRSV